MDGLGQRIRSLRKSRKMTLVDLADKTGIDQATLSRIENSRMIGTLTSHMKIADVLSVPLPQLYDDVIKKIMDSRDEAAKKKIEKLPNSKGVVSELLASGIHQKKMMPVLVKMKAKGYSENEKHADFSERFVYVLKGTLEITMNKEKKTLKTGESSYFDASFPHTLRNPQKSESRFLSVLTPVSI
jgi:transcriptional regulator with XRE-family HTH domain